MQTRLSALAGRTMGTSGSLRTRQSVQVRHSARRRALLATIVLLAHVAATATACSLTPSREPGSTAVDGHVDRGGAPGSTLVADFRHIDGSLPRAPEFQSDPTATSADGSRHDAWLIGLFGDSPPTDAEVVGHADGAFTLPEASQQIVLVNRGKPNATSASDTSSLLAIYSDSRVPELLAQFVPRETYRFIVATVPQSDPGLRAVLLSREHYQMGVLTVSADLLAFTDGQRQLLASHPAVYEDDCRSSVSDGRIHASTLHTLPSAQAATRTAAGADMVKLGPALLQRQDFTAPCTDDGDAPPRQSYTATR